jgi:ABC-type lipoprotein export system ATPase subunit
MVTHEPDIAAYSRRLITVRDGLIGGDLLNEHPHEAFAGLLAVPEIHVNGAAKSKTMATSS